MVYIFTYKAFLVNETQAISLANPKEGNHKEPCQILFPIGIKLFGHSITTFYSMESELSSPSNANALALSASPN